MKPTRLLSAHLLRYALIALTGLTSLQLTGSDLYAQVKAFSSAQTSTGAEMSDKAAVFDTAITTVVEAETATPISTATPSPFQILHLSCNSIIEIDIPDPSDTPTVGNSSSDTSSYQSSSSSSSSSHSTGGSSSSDILFDASTQSSSPAPIGAGLQIVATTAGDPAIITLAGSDYVSVDVICVNETATGLVPIVKPIALPLEHPQSVKLLTNLTPLGQLDVPVGNALKNLVDHICAALPPECTPTPKPPVNLTPVVVGTTDGGRATIAPPGTATIPNSDGTVPSGPGTVVPAPSAAPSNVPVPVPPTLPPPLPPNTPTDEPTKEEKVLLATYWVPDGEQVPQTISTLTVRVMVGEIEKKRYILKPTEKMEIPLPDGAWAEAWFERVLPPEQIEAKIARTEVSFPYCVSTESDEIQPTYEGGGNYGDADLRELTLTRETTSKEEAGNLYTVRCKLRKLEAKKSLIVAMYLKHVDNIVVAGYEDEIEASSSTEEEPNFYTESGAVSKASLWNVPANEEYAEDLMAEIEDARLEMLASPIAAIRAPIVLKPGEKNPGYSEYGCPAYYRLMTRVESGVRGAGARKIRASALAAILISGRMTQQQMRSLIIEQLRNGLGNQTTYTSAISLLLAPDVGIPEIPFGKPIPGTDYGVSYSYPLSYLSGEGVDFGPRGNVWRICYRRSIDERFTGEAIESLFLTMIKSEPDTAHIKNLSDCLGDLAYIKNRLPQGLLKLDTARGPLGKTTLGDDLRRFYLNLAINFFGGTCDENATSLIPNNFVLDRSFPQLLVVLDEAGNYISHPIEDFTKHLKGRADPITWLRSRFSLYLFDIAELGEFFRFSYAPHVAALKAALQEQNKVSLEYYNFNQDYIRPFACNALLGVDNLAYHWCASNWIISLLPIVGNAQDAMVILDNLYAGKGYRGTGSEYSSNPTPILDGVMAAISAALPMTNFVKLGGRGSHRMAAHAAGEETTIALAAAKTAAVEGDLAKLTVANKQIVKSLAQGADQAGMATAPRTLLAEGTLLERSYGKKMRSLEDKIEDFALFSMGPRFNLTDAVASQSQATRLATMSAEELAELSSRIGIGFERKILKKPIGSFGEPLTEMYKVKPDATTFIGRKVGLLQKEGIEVLFHAGKGGGGMLRVDTLEMMIPFQGNIAWRDLVTYSKLDALITFRHEYMHAYRWKGLMKGKLNGMHTTVRDLSRFNAPFYGGLGAYSKSAAADEIRRFGADARMFLRFLARPNIAQAERVLAKDALRGNMNQLGNLISTYKQAAVAEAKEVPTIFTKAMWETIPKDARPAKTNFNQLVDAMFAENPALVVAISKNDKICVPVGIYRGADFPAAAPFVAKYQEGLAKSTAALTEAEAAFMRLVPETPRGVKPKPGQVFGSVDTGAGELKVEFNMNADATAIRKAVREMQELFKIVGTLGW